MSQVLRDAVGFFESLKANQLGYSYYEIAGPLNDREHRTYTQSNYLLKVTFTRVGRQELANAIQVDPTGPNDDPTILGQVTGYRWCVLEGRADLFFLKGVTDSDYNDVLALLVLYWLIQATGLLGFLSRRKAQACYDKLKRRFDTERGVIQMDPAEQQNGLFAVYKIALLGLAARAMNDTTTADQVKQKLIEWQDSGGGWVTDRQPATLQPHGFANLETSCLCTLATL